MKIVRFGDKGSERPGIIDTSGTLRDASSVIDDWCGDCLSDESIAAVAAADLPAVAGEPRLGVPLSGIGKLIVIGLNYAAHAAEAGLEPPADPIIVPVSPTAANGATDDIMLPPASRHADWEIELGVVIGRGGSYISREEALTHVAGYCIANDVSEREYQMQRGSQWAKGKSCDTFKPLGPWLVTRDEIPDPQNLNMTLRLNDTICQQGNSSDMIYPVADLISRTSAYMTLCAGDVFVTGTPPGVGFGMKPPRYLQNGDILQLTIDGLGEQQSRIISHD